MPDLMCYGLDAEEDTFHDLVSRNPIIFRIHRNSDAQAFVAPAFHGRQSRIPAAKVVSRAQVTRHIVQWSTRDSPWISCTFSFPYVLWETTRRLTVATPELGSDLCISLIRAQHYSIEHRAILGVEALRGPIPRSSMESTRKAVNFARAFQEVLIYGEIPMEALLVTLTWDAVRAAFQQTHLTYLTDDINCQNSFRHFCEQLRAAMRENDVEQAKVTTVDQSMGILRELYKEVEDQEDLDHLREAVYDLSTVLFSWPYRHPSYHHKPYSDTAQTQMYHVQWMKQALDETIENHPVHRQAALLLRIAHLKQEIVECAAHSARPRRGLISGAQHRFSVGYAFQSLNIISFLHISSS
ncbi:hypothetical protein BDY19DRAFT_194896 [Irpex rosettiformis]|uniref:Uncharacterized protein n=1 Tax=Irpex rosettiformis TaxID=378272 RepID=A0ACB8U254_9APHY|nr:hypothetical protein BDY19DRAFT_194896 [Irpex rosettiformis]